MASIDIPTTENKLAKKSTKSSAQSADKQLVAKIKDSAQQIWLAGLGAFHKAQEEGTAAYEKLLEEGEAIQRKTREITEESVSQIAAKATGTWDKLELGFEARLGETMKAMGATTKKDVAALSKRIDQLTEQIKTLNTRQATVKPKSKGKPKSKTAVKPSKSKAG